MAGHVITIAMTLCGHYIIPTPRDIIINYHSLYHPLVILRREVCIVGDGIIKRICAMYCITVIGS